MRSRVKIVIAPDKFKGTLSATEVAEAMMRGARRVHPDASFALRPMADGGEGTVAALLAARGGRATTHIVTDPLGSKVHAEIGAMEDGTACIEMAAASGLQLVSTDRRDPLTARSDGTGELIQVAVDAGVRRIVVGVGGSATVDGGTGAARARGWRFLDAAGNDLAPGGGALVGLTRIDPEGTRRLEADIVGACDVDSPLLGAVGAARRFARQKGADVAATDRLEEGLARLAERIREDLDLDVASLPGAGAGGGMGAGLVAFFGARLEPGFDLVARESSLAAVLEDADLVVTGEGRLDQSSLRGKVPVGVARAARAARTTCLAVVGDLVLERAEWRRAGFELAVGLVQTGGIELAKRDPGAAIERATEGLLRHRVETHAGRRVRVRRRPRILF
ncbi:MAG: glycerate kinase family protein [Gaiellales bacterium]